MASLSIIKTTSTGTHKIYQYRYRTEKNEQKKVVSELENILTLRENYWLQLRPCWWRKVEDENVPGTSTGTIWYLKALQHSGSHYLVI
jgi:hypothetical protein